MTSVFTRTVDEISSLVEKKCPGVCYRLRLQETWQHGALILASIFTQQCCVEPENSRYQSLEFLHSALRRFWKEARGCWMHRTLQDLEGGATNRHWRLENESGPRAKKKQKASSLVFGTVTWSLPCSPKNSKKAGAGFTGAEVSAHLTYHHKLSPQKTSYRTGTSSIFPSFHLSTSFCAIVNAFVFVYIYLYVGLWICCFYIASFILYLPYLFIFPSHHLIVFH